MFPEKTLWGLFHVCYMCSSSISYMLTAACCGCIGKSQYLICRSSSSSSVADLFPPWINTIKGLFTPKTSVINYPYFIPNSLDLHSSSKHKLRYFWYDISGLTIILWSYENTFWCEKKTKILYSTILLLRIILAPFWRVSRRIETFVYIQIKAYEK